MERAASFRTLAPLLVLLSACSGPAEDEAVAVALVGAPEDLRQAGLRLPPAAQQLRAATHQGLVRLDDTGEVVPGVAQSWIVTDDGLSYIFRLRDARWADGQAVTAQQVRDHLRRTMRELRGTALGLDLGKVAEVRALTARVVEIELRTPMAQFLRVLAQPELGLARGGTGLGPMRMAGRAESGVTLEAMPPPDRGLPEQPDWAEETRPLRVAAMPAAQAVAAFGEGRLALVLGGDLATLPLLDTGPLARGAVRVTAAAGTFGLDVVAPRGFLAEPATREAVALAIDRDTLLTPFNLAGWTPTTRIVPVDLPGAARAGEERWANLALPQRQAIARARVGAWREANGALPPLRLALPPGPGSDLLFRELAGDLAAVGIPSIRVQAGGPADLALRDRVARYGQPRWFLNQFNCQVARLQCAPEADALVRRANTVLNGAERAALLAQAEALLTARNLHIPLGAPVRWSLVRGGVTGFAENPWAAHPLFPLSGAPI